MTSNSPEGWQRSTLGEITATQYGFTASALSEPLGPHFLRITDIVRDQIDWRTVPHCEIEPDAYGKYSLAVDDLVVARTGSVGASARISEPVDSVFASYLVRLRVDKSRADARFIEYFLRSPLWWRYVNGVKTGSVQPQLNAKLMSKCPLALPSLDEQKRIAGVLGTFDTKIAVNRTAILRLDELTRALWMRRFGKAQRSASSVAQGWSRGTVADLATTQYGHTASASDLPVGPHFLRVMDINKQNWIEWRDVPFCEADGAKGPKYLLRRGDIVVARMADPGKSAIIEQDDIEAVFASYLVRLACADLATARFVYGLLKSPFFTSYASAAKSGSVQQNMNAKVIAGAPATVPPVPELEAHLAEVTPHREALIHLVRENGRLRDLRDSLLGRLVTGQLRVAEDYNPATVATVAG